MAKGSSYEGEVCRTLSNWWTDGERDDVFWRTGGSGGRATMRAKAGKQTAHQHGDIAPTDPVGAPLTDLFVIEVKRGYSDATVHDLLDRTPRNKEQWYEYWLRRTVQSCTDAGTYSWLLIARRDRRLPTIWMPEDVFEDLQFCGAALLGTRPRVVLELNVLDKQIDICGFRFERFLDVVTKDHIMKMAKWV